MSFKGKCNAHVTHVYYEARRFEMSVRTHLYVERGDIGILRQSSPWLRLHNCICALGVHSTHCKLTQIPSRRRHNAVVPDLSGAHWEISVQFKRGNVIIPLPISLLLLILAISSLCNLSPHRKMTNRASASILPARARASSGEWKPELASFWTEGIRAVDLL